MKALHRKHNLKTFNTDMFLGKDISCSSTMMFKLSQGHYARSLLNCHGHTNCKTENKLMERFMKPNNEQCSSHDKREYNLCIGGLQHLSNNTRPAIAYAVNHFARFLTNL